MLGTSTIKEMGQWRQKEKWSVWLLCVRTKRDANLNIFKRDASASLFCGPTCREADWSVNLVFCLENFDSNVHVS